MEKPVFFKQKSDDFVFFHSVLVWSHCNKLSRIVTLAEPHPALCLNKIGTMTLTNKVKLLILEEAFVAAFDDVTLRTRRIWRQTRTK